MTYLQNIPIDNYRDILFILDVNDVLNFSIIDKYTNKMCDNKFYHQYIINNYNPDNYNLKEWNNDIFEDKNINPTQLPLWKEIFKRLNHSRFFTVKGTYYTMSGREYVNSIKEIKFSDTGYDIIKLLSNNIYLHAVIDYSYSFSININIDSRVTISLKRHYTNNKSKKYDLNVPIGMYYFDIPTDELYRIYFFDYLSKNIHFY
jgi:hypothetical protein